MTLASRPSWVWVGLKNEAGDGQLIPYSLTTGDASVSDPATWATHDEADGWAATNGADHAAEIEISRGIQNGLNRCLVSTISFAACGCNAVQSAPHDPSNTLALMKAARFAASLPTPPGGIDGIVGCADPDDRFNARQRAASINWCRQAAIAGIIITSLPSLPNAQWDRRNRSSVDPTSAVDDGPTRSDNGGMRPLRGMKSCVSDTHRTVSLGLAIGGRLCLALDRLPPGASISSSFDGLRVHCQTNSASCRS